MRRSKWDHGGKSAAQRGYDHRWKMLRDGILSRDRYLCQECKAKGRIKPASQVDHIVPKSSGGTNDPDNLQSICTPCHDAKSKAEAAAGRKRFQQAYRHPRVDEHGWIKRRTFGAQPQGEGGD